MAYTEKEILDELNLAFNQTPGKYFPAGQPDDVKLNFFLDLEHGYFVTAGNRIHLYADSTRWAIVFEKSGYQNRSTIAEIELDYIGNCIDYSIDETPERKYMTNVKTITLIGADEFARIENKQGNDMETFELVSKDIRKIKIRDVFIPFNGNPADFEDTEVEIQEEDNPQGLMDFGNLIRYLYETNPALVNATEEDIRQRIPKSLPKIMVIDEFHYESRYENPTTPDQQETYRLLAKVLVTRDSTQWKPTQDRNNHWSNWVSGNL